MLNSLRIGAADAEAAAAAVLLLSIAARRMASSAEKLAAFSRSRVTQPVRSGGGRGEAGEKGASGKPP